MKGFFFYFIFKLALFCEFLLFRETWGEQGAQHTLSPLLLLVFLFPPLSHAVAASSERRDTTLEREGVTFVPFCGGQREEEEGKEEEEEEEENKGGAEESRITEALTACFSVLLSPHSKKRGRIERGYAYCYVSCAGATMCCVVLLRDQQQQQQQEKASRVSKSRNK